MWVMPVPLKLATTAHAEPAATSAMTPMPAPMSIFRDLLIAPSCPVFGRALARPHRHHPTSGGGRQWTGVLRLVPFAAVVRRRVIVSGRVQGVFFRDSCQREAVSAGVTGWVRNRGDGAVEAEFEGPAEAVDRGISWWPSGPPRALRARLAGPGIQPHR